MGPIPLILMVFAFVCFVLASVPILSAYWGRLTSAGLAFWSLTIILTGVMGK